LRINFRVFETGAQLKKMSQSKNSTLCRKPTRKSKDQNQKRIEPGAAMEPTSKARAKFVKKKQTKETKTKKKQSKTDAIRRIMIY
jgi:hypothetical protein